MDLVPDVTSGQSYTWDEMRWVWGEGYPRQEKPEFHVVAVDYGLKRNILRCLATSGCKVTVVPATATAEDILARKPDGVFLSNGPGDPAATGKYAVPEIKKLVDSGLPVFGICLGHQMLGLALGGRDAQDEAGPPRRQPSGEGLHHRQGRDHLDEPRLRRRSARPCPRPWRRPTSRCSTAPTAACRLKGKPVFSVQYHPEASPGPEDSHYLFERFVNLMRARKGLPVKPEGKKPE